MAIRGIIDNMSDNNNNDINEVNNDMNDNVGLINYIMLGRIYDLLILICDSLGKSEDVLRIMELHGQGHLMSPLPSLVGEKKESQ